VCNTDYSNHRRYRYRRPVLYTVEKTAEGIMSKDVIVTQNVSKTYGKPPLQVYALRETNLQIKQGDYIAIIGPSGSGKSTLMNLLGCLDKPTSGNIFIDGSDVSTLNENELARIRREKIGFIFQKYNLIPTLNALENVELSMGFAGVDSQVRTAKAKKLLEMVELSKRLTHKPSEMSGGEQQRVAIARALANSPSIILADEPTGNVDTKSGDNIMNILEEVNRKGETIIVVTHNMAIAQRAKRVLRIQDGVVQEGHV
jgi:putative ABC transport system ATP-binding protein